MPTGRLITSYPMGHGKGPLIMKISDNDVVTIKLERENYESGLSETEKSHITENDLDDYQSFDYLVNNNGIIGLKEKAKELIKKEEGESNE